MLRLICLGRRCSIATSDFFGGVWLGLGLAMLYLVPSIERQTVLFQALWGAVFLGGIGQALSSRLLAFRRCPS